MDTKTWIRYFRRAVWVASLLRCVPFVRMVGLNGSMVTGTFHKGSDIDLYIVTKDDHIFVARMLVTFFLKLLGVRRNGKHIAGHICDNRFAIESYVDITPHDDYHARVFHNLIPLFDAGNVYASFRNRNIWMKDKGELLIDHKPVFRHSLVTRFIQGLAELAISSAKLETYIATTQMARVAADTRAHEPGSKVIVSSKELRFHLAKKMHG
jgi:predicted nucleotidyltransferase